MIKIMDDLSGNMVGFDAREKVTGTDYETVLLPAVEAKLKEYTKVRLLYYLGSDFTGYNAEALWDDTKIGFKHLNAWEKIALVTDYEWIRKAVHLFAFTLPGHVRIFKNDELAKAKKWLAE